MQSSSSPRSYHALLSSARVVLTVSPHLSGLVFLSNCTPDSEIVTSVTRPNYLDSFFLMVASPEEFSRWSWDKSARLFVQTPPDLLTDEVRALSALLTHKLRYIGKMTGHLNSARLKVRTGVDFQATVYQEKKMEAMRFKDSGYDESKILEYPYILQYADYAGISLKAAADAILLRAKLDTDLLAKTELVRLRYFNKVKQAASEEELAALYKEFVREMYVNKKIT